MPNFTGALKTTDGRDIARPVGGEWNYQTIPDAQGGPTGERTGNVSGWFRYDRLARSADLTYRPPSDDYNALVEIPGVGDVQLLTVMQIIEGREWDARFNFTARLPIPAETPPEVLPDPAPTPPDPFDADLLGVVCDKIEDDGFPAWVSDWIRAKIKAEVMIREGLSEFDSLARRHRETIRETARSLGEAPPSDAEIDHMMGADWNLPRMPIRQQWPEYRPSMTLPAFSYMLPIVAVDPSVPPGTVMARDADGRYRAYMDLRETGRGGDDEDRPPRREDGGPTP